MVEGRACVQREGVYRWFSYLTSAQRAEFLCGLLDLCVPIELRFLGSCLEDLARKDYHSLRDAEIRANNPTDLAGLANITDEVVRSKLLVSLALLGSDNREGAGVLYRILTHIDTVINNYGLSLNDGRTDEQFLLLFTMASHHSAFSFHQKQVLRQQLGQIQDVLQVSSRGARGAESLAAGPCNDKVPVCNPQLHHHDHDKPASTTSSPAASSSSPDASASHPPSPSSQTCHTHCTRWRKSQTREVSTVAGHGAGVVAGRQDQAVSQELSSPPPAPAPHVSSLGPADGDLDSAAPNKTHIGKAGKAVIESVALRGVTQKSEDVSEYMFETRWSDGFVSSVVRSQKEVTELLSQLSQAFPDEGVEKYIPQSTELDPRCLTALPCHVLQHQSFQLFFTSTRPLSPSSPPSLPSSSVPPLPPSLPVAPVASAYPITSSSNVGCTVQCRGANRAVYRVASVQPVISSHSSVLTPPSPHISSLPPPSIPPPQHSPQLSFLPPPVPALPTQGPLAGAGGDHPSSQSLSYSHHLSSQNSSHSGTLPQPLRLPNSHSMSHSHSQSLSYPQSHSQSRSQPHTQSQPSTPEQNSILDWLRKLRLHKYYPVFKQLTMEEFLALTEEDLNKYDLTQGAKKKLKTQLELQKSADREMKTEKRSCGGIARVTPSSHIGHSAHPSSIAELQVEVDPVPHHHPVSKDSSSSSGYSSSSCSPLCCDSAYERTRDSHRRVSGPDPAGGSPEKDRPCLFVLNSSCPTGFSRPTAQVLPVQTDSASSLPPSCSFSHPQSPYHPQASYPQTLLSPVSNPARILASPRKPRPPPLCTEDRTKPLGSGHPGFSKGLSVGIGVKLENLFPGLKVDGSALQDSMVCCEMVGGAVGLMVETSSALTSTSNSLHHVSHPPLHFHLSSSSSPSSFGYYSDPPTSSSSSSFSPFLSSSCPSTKSSSLSGSPGGGAGFIPMGTPSGVPIAAVSGNTYYPSQPTSNSSSSSCSAASLDQSSSHSVSMCVCSSCGCRGNCGAYGMLPGYAAAGYLQSFSACPSLLTLGPLLHLSPLVASSGATSPGATPFSYPMIVPPPLYHHSAVSHDQQQSFAFYKTHSVGHGGLQRPEGNLSCYNCGAGGHRAEECNQPSMEPAQQGTFRLKYSTHSDTKDSGD
ncbi:zinc finger CCHC domain-containing protein 14 [Notolabrus celidotus]|uniref:zinc finger CCHC domain-containing protein 14 n=1 Tax=Notolabrus celidotus TaxID=1203425 RepID=UPI00148FB385|nr:zinc finger CCHC domain-containing protein 14 [Notolabrus celidotus]